MNAGAMSEAPGGNVSVGKLSHNGSANAWKGFSQIFTVRIRVDRVAVPRFLAVAVAVTTGGGAVAGELSHDGCSNARQNVDQVVGSEQVVRKPPGVSIVAVGSGSIPVAAWASRAGARAAGNGDGAATDPKGSGRGIGYFDQVVSVQVVRARGRTTVVGVGSSTGRLPVLQV